MVVNELVNRIIFEISGLREFRETNRAIDDAEDNARDTTRQVGLLERALNAAGRASRGFGSILRRTLSAGFRIVRNATVGSVAAITGFAAAAINAASDVQESQSLLIDILGESADVVEEWAARNGRAFNSSTNELRQFAGDFAAQFVRISGAAEAADIGTALAERALDVASQRNRDAADVARDFTSAINGSTETVQRYAVTLRASVVDQFILTQGLRNNSREITENDRRLARYQIILNETSNAQGNAARTSGDFSNVLRRLQGQIANLLADVGVSLIPIATTALMGLIALIDRNSDAIVMFFENGSMAIQAFLESGGLQRVISDLNQIAILAIFAARAVAFLADALITTRAEREDLRVENEAIAVRNERLQNQSIIDRTRGLFLPSAVTDEDREVARRRIAPTTRPSFPETDNFVSNFFNSNQDIRSQVANQSRSFATNDNSTRNVNITNEINVDASNNNGSPQAVGAAVGAAVTSANRTTARNLGASAVGY